MTSDLSRLRALELAESLRGMGAIEVKRFFGGCSLVADGVQFAFVMKGTLYLRTDADTRTAFVAKGAAPFSYAASASRVQVTSYYEAPADILDDPQALLRWSIEAHAVALQARRKAGKGRPVAAGRRRAA